VYVYESLHVYNFIYLYIYLGLGKCNEFRNDIYIAIQSCFSLCQVKACLEKKLAFSMTLWTPCGARKCG